MEQWRDLHDVGPTPSEEDGDAVYRRRAWRDVAGREVIEDYRIAKMGHGTPLATAGVDACGASGPHMLDVGLSSTRLIAGRWGLVTKTGAARRGSSPAGRLGAAIHRDLRPPAGAVPVEPLAGVERTIRHALRSAGLLR